MGTAPIEARVVAKLRHLVKRFKLDNDVAKYHTQVCEERLLLTSQSHQLTACSSSRCMAWSQQKPQPLWENRLVNQKALGKAANLWPQ